MTIKEAAAAAKGRIVKTVPWESPTGEVFEARVPTSMQLLVFFAGADGGDGAETIRTVMKFLKNTFKQKGEYDRVVELIEAGDIDLPDIIGGDDGEGETEDGLPSLMKVLTEEVSGGRPTQSSGESSSASSATSGKRSTGRSPGKGSTRSNSQ